MAPIGIVLKNGLIFAVLSAPILYFAAYMLALAITDILFGVGVSGAGNRADSLPEMDHWDTGQMELFVGLLLSITVVGVIYMKLLSDTVEEGMVEF